MGYIGRVATAVQGMAKGMRITLRPLPALLGGRHPAVPREPRDAEAAAALPRQDPPAARPGEGRVPLHGLRPLRQGLPEQLAHGQARAGPGDQQVQARRLLLPLRALHALRPLRRHLQVLGARHGQRLRERRLRARRAHPAAGHARRRAPAGPGGPVTLESFFFYLMAAFILFSAYFVVTARNLFRCAIGLAAVAHRHRRRLPAHGRPVPLGGPGRGLRRRRRRARRLRGAHGLGRHAEGVPAPAVLAQRRRRDHRGAAAHGRRRRRRSCRASAPAARRPPRRRCARSGTRCSRPGRAASRCRSR